MSYHVSPLVSDAKDHGCFMWSMYRERRILANYAHVCCKAALYLQQQSNIIDVWRRGDTAHIRDQIKRAAARYSVH